MFLIYINDIRYLIEKYGFHYHLYADDIQIYSECNTDNIFTVTQNFEKLLVEIDTWMSSRWLKLNESKTEAIIFGQNNLLDILLPKFNGINFAGTKLQIKSKIRNIGCFMDKNLLMTDHINFITKSANYHLKKIAKIRKFIDDDIAEKLIHAFVTCKIDYQNLLLINLPAKYLNRLQLLLNSAARLISRTKKYDHITPVLFNLHWLPIKERIEYKIILLIHRTILFSTPAYIKDIIPIDTQNQMNLRNNCNGRKLIRSVAKNRLELRLFENYCAKLYNSLPVSLRKTDNVELFKKNLKTHLFKTVYNG